MNAASQFRQAYLRHSQNNNGFYIALGLIALCYLVTAMQLPVTLRSHTFHDDYLFWVNGSHIYNGDWLGPYNQMTLAKGAGFPLFLALNANLGIPITLSIALFNLAAFIFVTLSLVKIGLSRIIAALVFAYILFNPFLFPTHILRDNIYVAASLIAIFSFIRLCLSVKKEIILSGISGIFLGYFWIIREEGVWIIPGLVLIISIFIFSFYRKKDIKSIKIISINIGILIGIGVIFVQLISAINYSNYKIYTTVDFKEEYYKKSVNILNSIEPKKRISHIPVSEEQRKIAYSVSPSFAQLENYFEVTGKGWTKHLCNIYSWTCGDYAAGLFIWAYRDAVAELGYYKSGENASAFYKKIYLEILNACTKEIIKCRSNPFGFLPKLTEEQINLAPASIANAVKLITYQVKPKFDEGPSTEPYERLVFAKTFLRNPLSSPLVQEEAASLNGWFYHKGDAWPTFECNSPTSEQYSTFVRQASPDILSGTNDPAASHQRFYISLNNPEDCQLSYAGISIKLRDVLSKGGGGFNLGLNSSLYFDTAIISQMTQLRAHAFALKSKLVQIYQFIAPILIVTGLVLFIALLIVQLLQRSISLFSVVILGLWVLVFTRIFILVLVDISSFPAIQADYMGPAFTLVGLASILSIVLAIKFASKIISRKP